ncbi:hypothetical protein AAE02nite_46460 [Adhaeribacter aerolatus]|uniref:Uncharacterized protein n=1 Tax=Adhaeribacter aerolatus TaxID=670289 RepID=A0A512B4V4_9BACT|nr:hypothetical protein [Adhaeribacter aerolatus]GEO06982.1 hypothetical protein AAE02nite_46460 [Adhaeribacter aerolatus]
MPKNNMLRQGYQEHQRKPYGASSTGKKPYGANPLEQLKAVREKVVGLRAKDFL